MKKTCISILCLSLALLTLVFSAVSCGSPAGNKTNAPENTKTSAPVTVNEKTINSEETTEPDKNTSKSTDDPVDKREYTISDEVIVDNEYCTFKIVSAEVDSIWGFTLKAYCENKTSDKTMMFSMSDVAVNGYMCDPVWAEEVAAGKKSNNKITFSSSNFKEIGISTADEITFTLRVYDNDDWLADDFVKETYTIYPTGLSANEIVYPERNTTASEVIVVDNKDFSFIILETKTDSIWGYTLQCYLENKTDTPLMFAWEEVNVNGFMIDPFWAKTVPGKAKGYSGINFSDSKFEENGITNVENIEYILRVYNAEDLFADDIYKETLTYNP